MTDEGIDMLEIEEFRLLAVDTVGAAARLVSDCDPGDGGSVPLLTSIDDPHDVATIRVLPAGGSRPDSGCHAALDPLVATWRPVRRYRPRIAEHSDRVPSYFRLAVTDSGINAQNAQRPAEAPAPAEPAASSPIDLLWIGAPVDTQAGLMVMIGGDAPGLARPEPLDWPLPLSRTLGVRIYESRTVASEGGT